MLRRSGSNVQVHLLMDEEDVKTLERLATEGGESLSGLIRRIMKRYIKLKLETTDGIVKSTQ